MSQDICAALLTIFNKNNHTCERGAIEIDERENFQDNFILPLSFFIGRIHRNEN